MSSHAAVLATRLRTFEKTLDEYLKGYPEFNPSQSRGSDGRWEGGGGSASVGRKPSSGKKPGGKKPVTSATRVPKTPKQTKAQLNRARQAADRLKAAQDKSAAEQRRASDNFRREAERTRDWIRNVPYDMWQREPTFADEMFHSLINTMGEVWFIFANLATGFVPGAILGTLAGVTGLYLAARYVFRKMTTLGRYSGVRRPSSWDDPNW